METREWCGVVGGGEMRKYASTTSCEAGYGGVAILAKGWMRWAWPGVTGPSSCEAGYGE